MKKILALVIAMLMVLGMTSAFAADITISRTGTNIKTGHTYEAYQIFDGTLSGTTPNQVLSDIVWGAGVNGANLLAALQADATIGSSFTSAVTAEDVANAIRTSMPNRWLLSAAFLKALAFLRRLRARVLTASLAWMTATTMSSIWKPIRMGTMSTALPVLWIS